MFDKLRKLIKSTSSGASIGFSLITSAFMLTMMLLGNSKITIELMLFCMLSCSILIKAGELVLRICHLTTFKAWLPVAFVVGFAVISLLMVALALIANLSALTAFWITALSLLSLNYFAFREVTVSPSIDWTDTAIALVLAIIIGFFVRLPASSPITLLNTGILPIWSDYFLHGITIAFFGSPFASGIDMELVGVSLPFYHYAPFIIPAAFQMVSDLSGFALSTSLLLPMGLLIAAFGSYAFAVELGGRLGGLLALTAIICLPASSVFIQSGWFDFYWLLFIAPGSGYAVGVAAIVCASTVAYLKKNDSRVLCFTILLLFSLILIRVHLFAVLAPAILSLILLHHWRANSQMLVGIIIGVITIVMLTLHFSTHLHTLWMEYCNPHRYLDMVLQWSLIYGQPIKFLQTPFGMTMFIEILLVLIAILGIYLILYPLLLLLSVRRFGFHPADALPLLLLVSFIAITLFMPDVGMSGDFTEFKHRGFLLLYVVIAIYTITYAYNLMTRYITDERKHQQWVYCLVGSIFVATILLNWDLNPSRPNIEAMPWAGTLHNQQITSGLLESAEYVRTHAKQGDVLAMDSSLTAAIDPRLSIVQIVSLTGVPAFIARSDIKMLRSQCVQEIVHQRLSVLQELSSITNWSDAQKFLQTNGIRWFLVLSGERPKWDTNLKFAAFSSSGISVYDAGHFASDIFKKPQC